MTSFNTGDIVYIKWKDHFSSPDTSWTPLNTLLNNFEEDPRGYVEIGSAGIVVNDTPESVTLVMSLSEEDMYSSFLTIMKNSIIESETLRRIKNGTSN